MIGTRRAALLLIPCILIAQGCTTLPDVKPFADSTAALTAAAGADYHDISGELASLTLQQVPGEADDAYQVRKRALKAQQASFAATDQSLDALFSAMTEYSEKLASLASAGKTGADAAQSLLDSVKGFASLASIPMPAGTIATAVGAGLKAIANQFTQMQAQKSLRAAVDAAQPGVDMIAQQFTVIYGVAMGDAARGIRNMERLQASLDAGQSVIGFNDNVRQNYNAYYRYLNGIVNRPASKDPGKRWEGFCRDGSNPCRAGEELEAVGLVEARMAAIRPIVDSYNERVAAIDQTMTHRLKTSAAVVRAVDAWALEHEKVRRSLEDGTAVSAFNLRASLIELQGLLGQKQ